jgi:hypothetical protein
MDDVHYWLPWKELLSWVVENLSTENNTVQLFFTSPFKGLFNEPLPEALPDPKVTSRRNEPTTQLVPASNNADNLIINKVEEGISEYGSHNLNLKTIK